MRTSLKCDAAFVCLVVPGAATLKWAGEQKKQSHASECTAGCCTEIHCAGPGDGWALVLACS